MNLGSNPVLIRELRGRIRGNRALLILVIYLSIIAAVTLLVYAAAASSFSSGIGDPEAGRGIGKAIFITVMTVSLIQVCVITPSLTAGSIAGERERQTYDLLMTTLLSPLQIVLGKLSSALAFALLLIFSSLPIAGISLLFGGVSAAELVIGIVGLVMTAVCYAAVGLFWSAAMRTTLAATVMAQGSIILLLLGIPFLFVISSLLVGAWSDMSSPVYILIVGLLLSMHPFTALGISAATIASGEDALMVSIPSLQGDLLLPSPWLVYLVISLLLTILMLLLTVRMVRPEHEERVEQRLVAQKRRIATK
jgi:ABC-type transport system involved in multi-copper enzyme maturation permease subunit